MTDTDALAPLHRRALRHALEDGAAEIVLGFFTLMVGGSTQRRVFMVLAVCYMVGMRLAWKALHDRVTSRRTGFAEMPQDPAALMLNVVMLAGFLTIGIVAAITLLGGRLWSLELWPTWPPVLAATVLAGGFGYLASRSGLGRYWLLTAVSLAGGLFFWLFPFSAWINPSDRLTLFLFAMAAVLLLTGALAMIGFVRRHPVVDGEASHDH